MGSPSYMSSEQSLTPQTVDCRSDIWSLGVVLHQLLTNTLPFEGQSSLDVFSRVVGAAPTPIRATLPSLAPELEAIVLRCLEKEPAARYQTADELGCALRAYLERLRVGRTSEPWPHAERLSRPHPRASDPLEPEEPPRSRSGWSVLLATLLLLGSGAVYVAVAQRAGLIRLDLGALRGRFASVPELSGDALPPVELDVDRRLSSLMPRGVIARERARGAHGTVALRAEPEVEVEPADDEGELAPAHDFWTDRREPTEGPAERDAPRAPTLEPADPESVPPTQPKPDSSALPSEDQREP
jgi:hypothetical protein